MNDIFRQLFVPVGEGFVVFHCDRLSIPNNNGRPKPNDSVLPPFYCLNQ